MEMIKFTLNLNKYLFDFWLEWLLLRSQQRFIATQNTNLGLKYTFAHPCWSGGDSEQALFP